MATKLRALFQRRKGRDLFDLWYVFSKNLASSNLTIDIFLKYCEHDGSPITRKEFLKNLHEKHTKTDFRADMEIVLPNNDNWDFEEAFEFVEYHLIRLIPL